MFMGRNLKHRNGYETWHINIGPQEHRAAVQAG